MEENRLNYLGDGFELFKIIIVNFLLTIVTFGLYYPWAKAAYLRYIYSETEFKDSRFQFHGTGNEIFTGFIKVLLIFGSVYAFYFYAITSEDEALILSATVLLFLVFATILPLAIHGALRYRLSRTTWRGIHFGYRGDRRELFALYVKGLLLTFLTFGIYGAWFVVSLRNYTINRIRMGDIEFRHAADGGDFFVLNLKGYFLSIFTLGIYSFWWRDELFKFYIHNTGLEQNGKQARLKATTDGGGFLGLLVGNFFIVLFTLGLGQAWAITRTLRYLLNNTSVIGDVDFDNIVQTEEEFKDAAGEDALDFFDFDLI